MNMSSPTEIPVIDFNDFSTRYETIAEQVFDACKNVGFFQMINYLEPSVPQVQQAFDLSESFFAFPDDEKIKYLKNKDDTQRGGYIAPYAFRLNPEKQKKNENKETFQIIPSSFRKGISNSYFPTLFQEHNQDIERFSKSMHAAAEQVLELLSFVLKLSANENSGANDYLVSRHPYDDYSHEDNNALLFLRYPSRDPSKVKDEEILCGEHTDYSSLTLLYQKNAPGLQVETSDGNWITAPVVDNAILVNIGGMLEYHTKGLLKAANHRVVYMPEQKDKDRFSIGYFVAPAVNTDISNMPSQLLPEERIDRIPKDRILKTPTDYRNYRNEYYMQFKH